MKVSVITVTFNSVETIEDCVRSVLDQKYKDIEYIIVDGGSTDGTIAVLDRYRDQLALVISEPDEGIYDAMNKGVAAATGDVVGTLNSDDLYTDSAVIGDIVRTMQQENVDSCYGDLVYVKRDNINRITRRWEAGDFERQRFLKGWMPPHPTFFLLRKHFLEFGAFNLSFKTSADYELMLRMLYRHGISAAYVNRVVVKMRTGGQSNVSLKNRLMANREDRLAWRVNGIKPPLFTTLRKPLSKLGQFFKR